MIIVLFLKSFDLSLNQIIDQHFLLSRKMNDPNYAQPNYYFDNSRSGQYNQDFTPYLNQNEVTPPRAGSSNLINWVIIVFLIIFLGYLLYNCYRVYSSFNDCKVIEQKNESDACQDFICPDEQVAAVKAKCENRAYRLVSGTALTEANIVCSGADKEI